MNQYIQESPKKISGKFEEVARPLIKEGEYTAVIKEWKVIPVMYGRPKLVVVCNVQQDFETYELAYFCNLHLSPDNQIQFPGKRSNFYKIVRNLLPKSHAGYSLDDLIGLQCTAIVGTSDKTDRKEAKPVDEQYSVIRNLLTIGNGDDGALSH